MIPGFEHIVEERIKKAQKKGDFDNLPGSGKPLDLQSDQHIPEDLRLPYKILKNADCVPEEISLQKEIQRTEDLLAGMPDTAEKFKAMKKLNYLIMKLNTCRDGSATFDVPQRYMGAVTDCIAAGSTKSSKTEK
jgi:hypothetical protein